MSDSRYIIKPRALEDYIQAVRETTPLLLQLADQEDYISSVKQRLSAESECSESTVSMAERSYSDAEAALAQEEKRVSEANASRGEGEEEQTVSPSYYSAVTESRLQMESAQTRLESAHEAEEHFQEQISRFYKAQHELENRYQDILRKMQSFLDEYLPAVDAAKQAMYRNKNQGRSGEYGGSAVNIFTEAATLSAEETKLFSACTGYNTKKIQNNVRLGADGVFFIKTTNYALDGLTLDNGVRFETKEFELNGLKCRAVLPVFPSPFQCVMPPEYYTAGKDGTGKDFEQQQRYCVEQLAKAVENDEKLREHFTPAMLEQMKQGKTPDTFTWHHDVPVGTMRLVWSHQHNPAYGVAGGRGHKGGDYLWCGLPDRKIADRVIEKCRKLSGLRVRL